MKLNFHSPNLFAEVKATRVELPPRIVVYGESGVGKSTWASQAPDPIFLGAEQGTYQLKVARYPIPITTGRELIAALKSLQTAEHSFKTVVLDTIDWFEPIVWRTVLDEDPKKAKTIDLAADGYAKGYNVACDVWREVLVELDRLNEKGLGIVCLAHAEGRIVKNPTGDDYSLYDLKVHAKLSNLIREWSDAVLFCDIETLTNKAKGETKTKNVGIGERRMHTVRGAGYFAKNRYDLPDEMPMQFVSFAKEVGRFMLREEIDAAVNFAIALPETSPLRAKALAALETAWRKERIDEIVNAIKKESAQ
jgi:hypothetical protein